MKRTIQIFFFLFINYIPFDIGAHNIDSLREIANEILEKSKRDLSKTDIKLFISLADSLKNIDSKKSLFYIEKIIPFTKTVDDNHFCEMEALVIYAEGLIYANKLDSCVYILSEAIQKLEGKSNENTFINQLGSLYQYLGFAYRDKSDFVKAAMNFNYAALYFDRSGDQKNQISAKYNQANLLTRLNNLEEAKKAYEELIHISDNPVVHGVAYNSLGVLFMKKEIYSRALDNLLKSEELIEYANEPELTYLNLGIVYMHLEKYDLSKKTLLKAEEICKNKNRKRSLILINNIFVKLYYRTGNLNEAQEYLDLVQEQISSSNLTEQAVIYEMRSKIYEEEKKWEKANKFLKLKQIYLDSIESIEKFETINEIKTKYETDKKETEIVLLRKDKALQKAAIQRQQTISISAVVLSLLLLLIIILLYRQSKERKKTNAALAKQKDQIETLHKELTHRVKNNLFFISTLMKMQGRRLENKEARQAVKEGEARIEAMSLLHRKLYLEKNNGRIDLKEYLLEICNNLLHTFPYEGIKPRFALVSNEISVDGDTAMRIGLIINELITNSFKHAFVEVEKPSIHININENGDQSYQLTYQDNGVGFPVNLNFSDSSSLGLKLIHTLTKQLKGTVDLSNKDGAFVQLNFNQNNIVI